MGDAAKEGRKGVKLFYCYSHKDEKLRVRLETHLALLKRQELISDWCDRRINAGQDWRTNIDKELNNANIVLLLVSPDFLASDYCYDIEMRTALERHQTGRVRVIPVILRHCEWNKAPFASLQALPRDGKPIATWRDQDAAFHDVTRGIREAISSLRISELEGTVEKLKKVLIVDDERVISDTLAIVLNQNGYEATAAYSGTSCVERARHEQPWVVISDVIMPDMNGIEAAIRIKALLPRCHILLFSGQSATADLLEKAKAQGHDFDVLAKPVRPDDLVRLLDELGNTDPSTEAGAGCTPAET